MSAATTPSVFDRALAAQRSGRPDEAIAVYRAAIAAEPSLAPAYFNLAGLLRDRGEVAGAAAAFERAASLRPTAAEAWLNLGVCREQLNEFDAALAAYAEAARLAPNDATARFNAGNALRKLGDLPASAAAFEEAAGRLPQAPEIWLNLGNVRRELGRFDASVEALERAAALKPGWAEAEWNLALTKLAAGRLADGWRHYEARWARVGLTSDRGLPWPEWRGEPINGRSILVWREQGVGDEILFATCVPDLVALGATVTLAVDPRLVGLYSRAWPEVEVVADRSWGGRAFDYHVPMGSLPGFLRRSRGDFRPAWSQLMPARSQLVAWAERFRALGTGLRVGLNWRSGMQGPDRRRYYADAAAWSRLLRVPGVVFVNLQYDECDDELAFLERETGVRVHRWSGIDLKQDLESVAGLLWHLDLTIAAPTAVTSLSGALGTETWQVDPGTDWTVFGDERSPWFPAIRLFRKPYGERSWDGTITNVAEALAERAAAAGASAPA